MAPHTVAPASPTTIVTELTVANVKFGGNKSNGKYFFAFDNRTIQVKHRSIAPEEGVMLNFKLTDETSKNFVIVGLISSDSQNNLVPSSVSIRASAGLREVEVLNVAITPCVFNIAILVQDLENNQIIVCDPQVINTPGEGPNS